MYPSRTEIQKAKQQARKNHQLRVWTVINLVLMIVIATVLTYYFVFKEEEQTGTELSFYYPAMPDSPEVQQAFAPGPLLMPINNIRL
ncbi:hypothetical protein SAMN05661091_1545 [Paenibacillus uliginis N3/975]|uniref:Uncharacterized protein n=1 Tax=Paenibacillus uliginis N3/975 TaxID=1313296 RepID=A0A1X7H1R0_9BACL|nr:hypothetical protein [Paenibacillus uliginis]SMF78314.1 hypothetical protein SAMN05661091_1545 [Paenibacillus uliginis N3/975]